METEDDNVRKLGKPKKAPKQPLVLLRKLNKTKFLVIILLLALAAAGFFYKQYRDTQDKLNNPQAVSQKATDNLINDVSELIILPTDEKPTVATVSDVSKLEGQEFFVSAKNGDKVLIYSKANSAILYRPSDNKIVNVASLNTTNVQPPQQ